MAEKGHKGEANYDILLQYHYTQITEKKDDGFENLCATKWKKNRASMNRF